jgi:hypothetical protein
MPVSTPTVAPAAQPAVDAYLTLYDLTAQLYADPVHADTSQLSKYETSALINNDISTLKALAAAGIAYRGQPAALRLKVVSASSTAVTLTNCGLASTANPYERYYVKTGKLVPTSTPAVPPPYLKVLTLQLSDGRWKLASVATNSTRTCAL